MLSYRHFVIYATCRPPGFDFSELSVPAKLIWEIPAKSKDLIVPLEWNDLPLQVNRK